MPDLATALADLRSASAAVAGADFALGSHSDDALADFQRQLAESRRHLEVSEARVAAELAHRSRPELGYDGLAQRLGARSPEKLVQQLSGHSELTARRLVRVGVLVAERAAPDPAAGARAPWLASAIDAVTQGAISLEAADAIRSGLGEPSMHVTTDALADAARRLTAEAGSLAVERLAARAREVRDELDAAGVAEREAERRSRRYLHLIPQSDGMTRLIGLLDPESAAVVRAAVDAVTSPRRGGPRFVEQEDLARAARIIDDERSTEQIALDALVEMVDISTRAEGSDGLFGRHRPAVKVLVAQRDLQRRAGPAFIEGQTASISVESAQRHMCNAGSVPLLFDDDGRSLNLGRTQRLFSSRQRDALAARDGGCIAPDCDRPPSWTEAHHITEFSRGGRTDVVDGVLLCRHHHLWIHNNGWHIDRRGAEYWLTPPVTLRGREPVLLRSKSAPLRRLDSTTARD